MSRPVVVVTDSGPTHSLRKLGLSDGPIRPDPIPSATPDDPAPPDPQRDPRTVEEVLTDLRRKMSEVKNSQSKVLCAKVLAGEPFAQPGARDTMLQKVASVIGYLEPDADPRVLVRVLDESLQTFQDVDAGVYSHESNLRWAAEKIARAQLKKRSDRQGLREVARGLCAAARSAPRGQDLPDAPDDPGASYTAEELDAFAAQQGCSLADLKKRWIIQKGSSYWIYVNGRYQLPKSDSELQTCVYDKLAPADGVKNGVQLWTLNRTGNDRRLKTVKEILSDYCTVAGTLVASLTEAESYYDAAEDRFVEAVAPLRQVAPVFHPDVDRWLRLLGGSQVDKVLDWVASVTRLERQCCALFLFGSPDAGKTLLAHGLARLWSVGAPTELKRVLGDWSADLARCPLVFADEQIPDAKRGATSADLRELIGSSSRTLTRKFLPNADLLGAVRLVLASNNFAMLALNEVLGAQDIEAVAGRFLFVKVDDSAGDYLKTITTRSWVDGDVIAEHALWLRDNRAVHPGRRFLVEGQKNSWTRLLAVQGPIPGMVAEWLARCLSDQSQKAGPRQRRTVLVRDGNLYVSTQALLEFWDLYVKHQRQPNSQAIAAALGNMSRRKVRHANSRYWEIDTDTLIAWADENLIASEDDLRAALLASYVPGQWEVDGAAGEDGRTGEDGGTGGTGGGHASPDDGEAVPAALAAAGVKSGMVERLGKRIKGVTVQ